MPGPRRTQIDEALALELLRAGRPLHRVRRVVGGGLRRIREIAQENGIAFHRRRTDGELARQDAFVLECRNRGVPWAEIARRLGYPSGALSSLRRRYRCRGASAALHARRNRALYRELRRLKSVNGMDEMGSFFRLAADPRRHWLLTAEEIELARRYGVLALAAPKRKE